MAAIYKRVTLPPSRTICMLFAVLLLFGTNVTLVILRTMMTYTNGRAIVNSDFRIRVPASGYQSVASVAGAFGCSNIGNGSPETGAEQMKCKRKVLRAALAMDQSGLLKHCGFKDEYEAAIIGTPLQPLANFLNPCWFVASNNVQGEEMTTRNNLVLRCLPEVLLLGSGRCGVRDLGVALSLHPHLYGPDENGTSTWKDTGEAEYRAETFSKYVDTFDKSAKAMQQTNQRSVIDSTDGEVDTSVMHEGLIFDAAPRYTESHAQINTVALNSSQTFFYLPSALRLVTPKVKLLFMLRDPVERSFSDFCSVYNRAKHGLDVAKAYDSLIREAIIIWQQCTRQYGERQCINDLAVLSNNKHRLALRILTSSLYSLHLRSWLENFPRSQMLFIKSEDYFANRVQTLNEITDFLQLARYPGELMRNISRMSVVNRGRVLFLMWDKTRRAVDKFYEGYNRQLAALLKDGRFMWSQ